MGICERTTCTENNSPCRATEAGFFSNVVCVSGHHFFHRIRRSKTVFFDVNSGRKFAEKRFNLNLRRIFRFEIAAQRSFEKVEVFLFSAMCNYRLLVFKCGLLTRSNLYIKFSNEIRKVIATSLLWIGLGNDLFRKKVSFQHLPNVCLYPSLVFALKQSLYQKVNSIQRIYCIMFDVILRTTDNDVVIYGTTFPKTTFDFVNAWRTLFCFQILDVNFRKNHIFDSFCDFGSTRWALNCSYNMVLRLPNLVYSMLVFKS